MLSTATACACQLAYRCRCSGCGYSLLEVLVALLVLALGLLGMSSLMMRGLTVNHSASLRSQAVIQAYDVIDRMRANQPVAEAGDYDIALAASATGTSIAAQDINQWKTNLSGLLPAGDGAVVCLNAVCTVTVQWDDSRAGGSSAESIQVSTRL